MVPHYGAEVCGEVKLRQYIRLTTLSIAAKSVTLGGE